MTKTLKPCPFCGGEAVLITPDDVPEPYCWVICSACRSGQLNAYYTPDEAAYAWNRRTPNV